MTFLGHAWSQMPRLAADGRIANAEKGGYAEGLVCRKDKWRRWGIEPPHGTGLFQDAEIGRIAMGRTSSGRPDSRGRRTRPALEGLEGRLVMSRAGATSVIADQAPRGGVFSENFQTFRYTTPQGTRVKLQIVGRGSLEGTTVDSSGALHLLYSKTNAYTKITSDVHGGTGRAPLASIFSRDLFDHQAANSLSGIGASIIGSINLTSFDLIAGGTIDATAGLNLLGLNSVGPNTQIQLREIPSTVTAGSSTTTTSAGVNGQYINDRFLVQTLAGSDGEFFSAGNLLLQSQPTEPGPPPAPPGVVIKINRINGRLRTPGNKPVDLLTDAKIFGYDPTTGQVHRFSLDLVNKTGAPDDQNFAPISVAGSPAQVGLSLGRDGTGPQSPQVLLVASGSNISVYNATTGSFAGSFTTPAGFNSLGSTDTITVAGNVATNQLQMIDVAASLAAGTAVTPEDNPSNYSSQPGFSLLGGLSGLPGSNRVYALSSATFNTFQPLQLELGLTTVETSQAVSNADGGFTLVHGFSTVSQKAFTRSGAFVPIPNSTDPQLGTSMGSVDRDLAVNTLGSSGTTPNTVALYGQISLTRRGTITIAYPNQLSDLSETFRPDLAGTALIDVQGNIQSFRGLSANGLVLNNTGNLNLLRTGRITNSTILAQPVGHIQAPISHRSNVLIISTKTITSRRHPDIKVVPSLQQVGPLSQPFDGPIG